MKISASKYLKSPIFVVMTLSFGVAFSQTVVIDGGNIRVDAGQSAKASVTTKSNRAVLRPIPEILSTKVSISWWSSLTNVSRISSMFSDSFCKFFKLLFNELTTTLLGFPSVCSA